MNGADEGPTPIVEPKPNENERLLDPPALRRRIRQQEILAELGVGALQGAGFEQLLGDTARLTAEGIQAEFCKILEYMPAENCFLVRAGVGWGPGIVGTAKVGADLASPAGFALRTGKPVISNHLENEERFRTPELLLQYGIRRAMNVILQGDGKPFGVLEVDSRSEDEFVAQDLAFLQGAANILGMAIERERHERSLKAALAHQQVLLQEIRHRVKNSLAIVASMLSVQSNYVGNPDLTRHLQDASNRISAVAKAHERIDQGHGADRLDLGIYIEQICRDLDEAVNNCTIEVNATRGIVVMTDRAIPIALIANELITNAAKYAYPSPLSGIIRVRLAQDGNDQITLSVSDEGAGLPPDFDIHSATGFGMRLLRAFSQQLKAKFTAKRLNGGTEFMVTVPRES